MEVTQIIFIITSICKYIFFSKIDRN